MWLDDASNSSRLPESALRQMMGRGKRGMFPALQGIGQKAPIAPRPIESTVQRVSSNHENCKATEASSPTADDLPRVAVEPPPRPDERAVTDDSAGSPFGRVLLLEDDSSFREIIHDVFAEHGYAVTAVQSGLDGLKAVMAGDFEAVVCDMKMPEMSGDIFYRAIERVCPHLCGRFVFMTGYQATDAAKELFARIDCHVLRKPFRMADLLGMIEFIQRRSLPAKAPTGGAIAFGSTRDAANAGQLSEKGTGAAPCGDEHDRADKTDVSEVIRQTSHSAIGAFVGLALFGVMAAVPLGWYFEVREKAAATAMELLVREQQWATISPQLQHADMSRQEGGMIQDFAKRVAAEREGTMWTLALRSVAAAREADADLELRKVEARGGSGGASTGSLWISGVCNGRDPRLVVTRFQAALEQSLKQYFGDKSSVKLKTLDIENSDRPAVFTMHVVTGSDAERHPERSEGQ
jgi:CheY-like chemotaxis protein